MRRLFEGGAYSSNYCNWQLKSLLHLGQIVITFRTLLHLGQNVITFRTLLHLGLLHPDHTAAFFIREIYNLNVQKIFTCAIIRPFQKYPGSLQIHRKDPLVLWHMELPLQLCFPVAHSFTSAKQEVLLFSLPFF